MSIYQKLTKFGTRFVGYSTLFKYVFNFAPMYRRSTGKITYVSKDLALIKIKIPISWRNKNYMGSVFGGSMFAAVDPIPMVQLINILGDDYVVWDKSAIINFKRPAYENLYAEFTFSDTEVQLIKDKIASLKEFDLNKQTNLTNLNQDKIFCEIIKTLYIADKTFYKEKQQARKLKNNTN